MAEQGDLAGLDHFQEQSGWVGWINGDESTENDTRRYGQPLLENQSPEILIEGEDDSLLMMSPDQDFLI